jgi:hypothetical protein
VNYIIVPNIFVSLVNLLRSDKNHPEIMKEAAICVHRLAKGAFPPPNTLVQACFVFFVFFVFFFFANK